MIKLCVIFFGVYCSLPLTQGDMATKTDSPNYYEVALSVFRVSDDSNVSTTIPNIRAILDLGPKAFIFTMPTRRWVPNYPVMLLYYSGSRGFVDTYRVEVGEAKPFPFKYRGVKKEIYRNRDYYYVLYPYKSANKVVATHSLR